MIPTIQPLCHDAGVGILSLSAIGAVTLGSIAAGSIAIAALVAVAHSDAITASVAVALVASVCSVGARGGGATEVGMANGIG